MSLPFTATFVLRLKRNKNEAINSDTKNYRVVFPSVKTDSLRLAEGAEHVWQLEKRNFFPFLTTGKRKNPKGSKYSLIRREKEYIRPPAATAQQMWGKLRWVSGEEYADRILTELDQVTGPLTVT